MYFTYIIRCKDDSLYTGYTSDIVRRMNEHKSGINSKYTRAKGFKKLEIYFATNTKSNAMKLECYIKKLTRNKKLSIIKNPDVLIDLIDNKYDYVIGKELEELA
ncbi:MULTISPECIES: GIY-YIG nuclease family protein [unclassified Clostridioides]|uniref:GIY-YIG nuclease family protein n=1 Tax=unclassified Clostridioides TaxID=2635829 RepID=UPI001D102CB0|nr:GIY-YIG nuclease family protein [Clostridioides sp. ES-S-0171-01]MCC0689943.1 GIY-YIG nuclease family protein [Clostridioides sp. ES-S-0056-01]MCC0716686.1 GIY-YIG nuclease family protein [Clostridioides sp. ES-S-0077-01]UDN56053.1 GIY-YIG nuclease family protein [Clostridioides sp. ES-S-0054-01]